MFHKSRTVFVLLALFSLTSTAWAQFSFQGLGIAGGPGTVMDANGISGDGRVIVGASGSFQTGSVWQSVLWMPTTGFVSLGNLPSGTMGGRAFSASFDGSVIVGSSSSANGQEAYRWTASNGMVGLRDLQGSGVFASTARGVSANGSVIVGYSMRSGVRAFRWTTATGMADLGDLPGGENYSFATAVTPDGSTVVGSSKSGSSQEAFIWTAASGMVGLGNIPGGSSSQALAISADGKVVVGYDITPQGFEAFRWTKETGMIGMGSLNPLDFASVAYGVSADGNVIVGIGSGAADLNGEAFVWFPGTGMLNLQDYLVAHGVTAVQGWQKLTGGTGISSDGRTICGTGINPQGKPESWVAHIEIDTTPAPPPPSDTTETLLPTSVSILSGMLVSGGVPQVQSNDNTYLRLQSTAKAPMQVVLTGQVSRPAATELRFSLEAAAEGSTTRQEIALFDFVTRTWVTLNSRTATTADSTVEVRVTDRPARFIEPGTLRVQARVTLVPSGGKRVTTHGRIDRAFWTRVP